MDSVSQKTYGQIDGTHEPAGSYAAARQSNLFANHDILPYRILFFKRFPQDSDGSRDVKMEKIKQNYYANQPNLKEGDIVFFSSF